MGAWLFGERAGVSVHQGFRRWGKWALLPFFACEVVGTLVSHAWLKWVTAFSCLFFAGFLFLCLNRNVVKRVCGAVSCWYYFAVLVADSTCSILIGGNRASHMVYTLSMLLMLVVGLPLMGAVPPRLWATTEAQAQRVRVATFGVVAALFMCGQMHSPTHS